MTTTLTLRSIYALFSYLRQQTESVLSVPEVEKHAKKNGCSISNNRIGYEYEGGKEDMHSSPILEMLCPERSSLIAFADHQAHQLA